MLIGMGTCAPYLPLFTTTLREINILSFWYADTYLEAYHALLIQQLPTQVRCEGREHSFKFKYTRKAFEMLAQGVNDKGRLRVRVRGS